MKNLSAFLLMLCMLFVSCAQPDEEFAPATKTERVAKLGVLRVASESGFAALVDEMKQMGTFDVRDLPQTRSGEVQTDETFVSLREHLIEQGLREFTDEELAEIIADSLEYDPEDSLIVDPYMMALLNENREVQIGDMVYRYIDEGLLIYDAPVFDSIWNAGPGHIFDPGNIIWPDSMAIQDGESTVVVDNNGNEAIFHHIVYRRNDLIWDPSLGDFGGGGGSSGGTSGGSGSNPGSGEEEPINGLLLNDGSIVPESNINFAYYEHGEGDGSWIQKGISGLLGTNVVVINKFDSTHRMKLRMFDMDYLIYKSCGMTVRMQKKSWGIWWRKKAQRIYYGWTPLEIEYKFPHKIFFDPGAPTPPNVELGEGDIDELPSKYPDVYTRDFPLKGGKVALFHVPANQYDFRSGNIGQFFNNYMSTIGDLTGLWSSYLSNKGLANMPYGLYTPSADDCRMLCIYPPYSQYVSNDGREVIRWESMLAVGAVTYCYKEGESFSYKNIGFEDTTPDFEIMRGGVYGAVMYGNQLRACIIGTK